MQRSGKVRSQTPFIPSKHITTSDIKAIHKATHLASLPRTITTTADYYARPVFIPFHGRIEENQKNRSKKLTGRNKKRVQYNKRFGVNNNNNIIDDENDQEVNDQDDEVLEILVNNEENDVIASNNNVVKHQQEQQHVTSKFCGLYSMIYPRLAKNEQVQATTIIKNSKNNTQKLQTTSTTIKFYEKPHNYESVNSIQRQVYNSQREIKKRMNTMVNRKLRSLQRITRKIDYKKRIRLLQSASAQPMMRAPTAPVSAAYSSAGNRMSFVTGQAMFRTGGKMH